MSLEDMKIEARRVAVEPSASTKDEAQLTDRMVGQEPTVQIKSIDVACGKERMTVRVTFDDRFNGIIYAKVSFTISYYSVTGR